MTGPAPVPTAPPTADREAGLAVCPLFTRCGGCSLLHLSDEAYAARKVGHVAKAFAAHGLAPDIAPLVTVPLASRRRATFTAQAVGNRMVVGYQSPRSHELVDVTACPALAPPLQEALPAIRAVAEQAAWQQGRARITATLCHNGVDLALTRPAPVQKTVQKKKRHRRERERGTAMPPPLATDDPAVIRLAVDGEPLMVREPPVVRFDGVDVPFPPGAFLQASLQGEAALQALVVAAAKGVGTVLDAFCGLGTFAAPLSRHGRVTAVEADGGALAALAEGMAHAQGRRPVETLKRDLMRFPLAPRELAGFDLAVFDPPRAGAQGLARSLAGSAVARVVAVSCAPDTLARDCAILAESGYKITQVTPVDQFVGTDHIEAVATMRRE